MSRQITGTNSGGMVQRRASTQSIHLSYGYGAPTIGKRLTTPEKDTSLTEKRPEMESQKTAQDVGRPLESAEQRYQRFRANPNIPLNPLNQGKSKVPIPSRLDTSVNIASAFKGAFEAETSIHSHHLSDSDIIIEETDPDPTKETVMEASNPAKKRKRKLSKDSSFRPGKGSASEESENEAMQRPNPKKAKQPDPEQEDFSVISTPKIAQVEKNPNPTGSPATASRPKKPKRKPLDKAYRPKDHPEPESEEISDEDRRRRKSKGRYSLSKVNAIDIGQRDSANWMSKAKRIAKRHSRLSNEKSPSVDPEDGDSMTSRSRQDSLESPIIQLRPPPASPSISHIFSSPGSFAAFDPNSFQNGSPGESGSGVAGSSYDYAEEESLVRALEQKQQAEAKSQEFFQHRQPSSGIVPKITLSPTTNKSGSQESDVVPPPVSVLLSPQRITTNNLAKRVPFTDNLDTRSLLDDPPSPMIHEPIEEDEEEEEFVKPVRKKGQVGVVLGRLFRMFWEKSGFYLKRAVTAMAVALIVYSLVKNPTKTPVQYTPVDSSVQIEGLEDLITRITTLERTINQLGAQVDKDRALSIKDRHAFSKTEAKFTTSERLFLEYKGEIGKVLSTIQSSLDSTKDASARDLQLVQARVSDLDSKGASYQSKTSLEFRNLQKDVDGLKSSTADISKRLASFIDTSGRLTEQALKPILARIESTLPDQPLAKRTKKGALELDPVFWKLLQSHFVDESKAISLVQGELEDQGNNFIKNNDAKLKAWLSNSLESLTNGEGILNKQSIMKLLKTELSTVQVDVGRLSKQISGVKNETEVMIKNVLKQASKRESNLPTTEEGKILQIVNAALLKYSKDVIAKPDFALSSSGGRVYPALTSRTYVAHPAGAARSALGWLIGSKVGYGRPPVTALHPDNSPGSCWPMAGNKGQIGIALSRPVTPSDITIEHVSKDIAFGGQLDSAPKDFEAWGLVDKNDFESMDKLAEYLKTNQLEEDHAEGTAALLTRGTYDINASNPVQTFAVDDQLSASGIKFAVVVVKILNNYGLEHYTCLYRIRVGGTTDTLESVN